MALLPTLLTTTTSTVGMDTAQSSSSLLSQLLAARTATRPATGTVQWITVFYCLMHINAYYTLNALCRYAAVATESAVLGRHALSLYEWSDETGRHSQQFQHRLAVVVVGVNAITNETIGDHQSRCAQWRGVAIGHDRGQVEWCHGAIGVENRFQCNCVPGRLRTLLRSVLRRTASLCRTRMMHCSSLMAGVNDDDHHSLHRYQNHAMRM